MTPEQIAELEVAMLAEINRRVAEADARCAQVRAEAQEKIAAMLGDSLQRLFAGLPPRLVRDDEGPSSTEAQEGEVADPTPAGG